LTFPIVALGASAGGLEALFEFLSVQTLPTHMAYVVIQHLDREHKSLLAELLAKKTEMPVLKIEDGSTVEPGHCYVIPPNTSLTLIEERFRLTPRSDTSTPHHPVDIFFQSLAETRADATIGVILSGGDSDGALGIQALKHAGGITFAQEPSSTRFPGMPQNAIDTGYVDYVLRPFEIAREIERLSQHPYLQSAAVPPASDVSAVGSIPQDSEGSLKRVFRRLRTTHGVDFSHYKRNTLQRRLARRMAVRRTQEFSDYVALLEQDPAETAALYQDFLIRVTGFFRDPESFEHLRTRIFPNLCEGRSPKEPIRIWVPGCASGEEVYSIAMTLVEYLGEQFPAARIQIFGSDVSEAAIEKARVGAYLENILEEVTSERLARFFVKENSHYHIAKSIRDLCIFAHHDVTRDPPFSRLDLVSCRNLLIYLDSAAQRRVMQRFHYALRPHGFLVLGPSESVGTESELFELIDKSQRVYTRKGTGAHVGELGSQPGATPNVLRAPASDDQSFFYEIDSVQREADRLLLTRYAPAGLLVDEELNILQFRGDTAPYLAHASGAASLNLHRVARPQLLVELSPAIQEAREKGSAVRREGLRVDDRTDVTVEVIPLNVSDNDRYYQILIEDASRGSSGSRAQQTIAAVLPESEKDRRLGQLEREIVATRDYLQAVLEKHESANEELKSAHEEVLSANEEFQSTNEELETAKEELQSANEELTTTNDELRTRNRELSVLNTELQKARETALLAQRYADAIIESVREPLVILDLDLRVLRANRSFYENLKMRREDAEGRLLSEVGRGQWNKPDLLRELSAVLTSETPVNDHEFRYEIVPGARARTLSLSARKIPGDTQREQLILLAIEDVTERNADAEQLHDAARRTDEFLAMLAHELRNPLTPIAHAIHLLQSDSKGVANPKLYAMIERQTQRLRRLVEELLDVARISHGHIELRRTTLDLAAIAQQAVEASRARLEGRHHELSVALPKSPVPVDGDPVRLEQVITNLLENAAKYTEPGGRIQLRLTQDRTEALLSVRDNGIGIAPEHLETIFDLFTQVDSSLARQDGGLGIGLTLVRRVLELHGGHIEARSAGVGHGTEFIVRLPLAYPQQSDALPESHASVSSPAGAATTSRVLIVDDNLDVAETTALLARHWGHEVAVAPSGPAALELAQTFRPDHALVDIGLPGMDGYELGRQLREHHPDLHLVAMTGYGRKEDRKAAYSSGFNAHLVKPADLEALREILANGRAPK
jgi:two-component system, chemotaxis family, CheB/CheR fusion protein